MTHEEKIENNRLIARWKLEIGNNTAFINDMHPNNLLYHCSWDWLIPVASMTALYVNVDDEGHKLQMEIFKQLRLFDKEKLWLAVVEFIKWYNLNQ